MVGSPGTKRVVRVRRMRQLLLKDKGQGVPICQTVTAEQRVILAIITVVTIAGLVALGPKIS